jgi:hypothetical protein
VALFEDGCDYLLRVEQGFGAVGRWVGASEDLYTRYHASYCAVVGLAECAFAQVRIRPLVVVYIHCELYFAVFSLSSLLFVLIV